MSAAAAWDRVLRAALLGTERQPAPEDAATGDPALDAPVAALADRPAEARLLETAALLDAWRRAGQRAPRSAAPPAPPAPETEEHPSPPAAARVLRQIVGGGDADLLPEWLSLAARAGIGIPDELLPAVLEVGRRHERVRGPVAAGIGARGRWLAALNPAWGYAAGAAADPREAWETGTHAERVAALLAVHGADPAAGRALLQGTWEQEEPRTQAAFLHALRGSVTMDDEPFLEDLLQSRRKEVRAAAGSLLAELPGSRLVVRMVARLEPLLHVQAPEGLLSRLRRTRIDVELPAECDAEMQRDGIDPKPPGSGGPRVWWLRRMIATVPPSVWAERWAMEPAACVDAARAGEHGDALVSGWVEATLHTGDAAWAEALLRAGVSGQPPDAIARTAALVPPERLEPLALERLREGRLPDNPLAAGILDGARFPWSPALTAEVLGGIPADAAHADYALRARLKDYALHMHPAAALSILREQGDPHEGAWIDRLHLRHTLHQAFDG